MPGGKGVGNADWSTGDGGATGGGDVMESDGQMAERSALDWMLAGWRSCHRHAWVSMAAWPTDPGPGGQP